MVKFYENYAFLIMVLEEMVFQVTFYPQLITPNNPLGKVPVSSVSYDMSTSMIQLNFVYKFGLGSSKSSEPSK